MSRYIATAASSSRTWPPELITPRRGARLATWSSGAPSATAASRAAPVGDAGSASRR